MIEHDEQRHAAVAPVDVGERLAGAGRRLMIATAKAIIRPAISFGIMPAPGAERVPNGRSPLSANTTMPSATKAPGDVVGAEGHQGECSIRTRRLRRPDTVLSAPLTPCEAWRGGVGGGGGPTSRTAAAIVSITPSTLLKTSLFQKRSTQ